MPIIKKDMFTSLPLVSYRYPLYSYPQEDFDWYIHNGMPIRSIYCC